MLRLRLAGSRRGGDGDGHVALRDDLTGKRQALRGLGLRQCFVNVNAGVKGAQLHAALAGAAGAVARSPAEY